MMHEHCNGCNNNKKGRCVIIGAPTSNIPTVVNCYAHITGYVERKEKKKDVIIDIDDI